MSIKCYVGRMGSGKSYEVVSVVILEALRRGRRVVSNIAGLNYLEFRELLVEQGTSDDEIGQLVQVDHEEVLKPTFWRCDSDGSEGIDSFIKPGDLVALDEIWRFWNGFSEKGMSARVMNFYRMHRHFTHEQTGVCCDVALITQDIGDVARKVRAVVEETYRMQKHTAVGSTKYYRVDVYAGGRVVGKPLNSIQRQYDPRYFPLYSSHSQKKEGAANAVEENIDGRGNILKGAIFKIVLPIGLLLSIGFFWVVYRFFFPAGSEKPAKAADVAAVEKPGRSSLGSGQNPADREKLRQGDKPGGLGDISDKWRVAGLYSAGDRTAYMLTDTAGRTRILYDAPGARINGLLIQIRLPEGGYATSFSGAAPTKRDKSEEKGSRDVSHSVAVPQT